MRSHHNIRNQWSLMQGTNKDASRCTRSVAPDAGNQCPEQVGKKESCEKLASTRISRNQRDTLRISWNIICKLVVLRFVQSVDSAFCTVSRGLKLGIMYQFSAKTTTDEQFQRCSCYIGVFYHNVTQLCCRVTPAYHCSTLNETLFEWKCFQARFLVFQTETRRRRASQGIVDTTTVHHQSSRNLSRFRKTVSQIQLSEWNFFQAQTYADSFVIAVCRCLSLCCR